ncbi:MAG: matrixin family metalloprotease, partial [Bdellovibrionota bacterium]
TNVHIIDSEEVNPPDFDGTVSKVSGDHVNGIYWVREKDWAWGESDPDAVAMTVVSFSHDGISEADVFFRAKVFARKTSATVAKASISNDTSTGMPMDFFLGLGFTSTRSLASAAYNLASSNPNPVEHQVFMVSVHEMGHAMGRCHSSDSTSIMYPSVSAGTEELREHPLSQGDLDTLSQVYKL